MEASASTELSDISRKSQAKKTSKWRRLSMKKTYCSTVKTA
jgi:hypothetical protein